ncbi:type II toxin-antitoxin system RelE/ParE family toxin [Methylomonas sp. AM2-LC]|uniref:type II toxin-antitoxin system RelE/ParE family toxin n=1 Tax=Methylomonas sp. AM2-LC TaxID=3153301 RepID=UPI003265801D
MQKFAGCYFFIAPSATMMYIFLMNANTETSSRIFKTAWFAKAAKKALITNEELCLAIQQVMLGQSDDLGGGVFKKRLNNNRHRSIILAKGGRHWVYTYLFAKKDRDNISSDELAEFKKLAALYGLQTDVAIDAAIKNGDLLEICNAQKTSI